MPFVPFFERFPELGRSEVKVVTILEEGTEGLPKGAYFFWDSYCDEPGCDCRRVFINVYSESNKNWLACISYGWEPRDFYRKWGHGAFDEADIDDLQGPCLDRMQPQSRLAPALLKIFTEVVLPSPGYAERIECHYRMFRGDVEKNPPDGAGSSRPASRASARASAPPLPKAPSRNAPCPCGSGRKYKKCCMPKEPAPPREVTVSAAALPVGTARKRKKADSPGPPSPPLVDEVRLARLKREAMKRCKAWEADLFSAPMLIKGGPGGSPYSPPLALVVDRESGYILAADIADPVPDLAQSAPHLVASFLKGAEQIGALPEAVVVNREELARVLRPTAERLGVKIEIAKRLPELGRAKRAMAEQLGR